MSTWSGGCLEGDCEDRSESCEGDGRAIELVQGRGGAAQDTLVDGTNGVGGGVVAGAGARVGSRTGANGRSGSGDDQTIQTNSETNCKYDERGILTWFRTHLWEQRQRQ